MFKCCTHLFAQLNLPSTMNLNEVHLTIKRIPAIARHRSFSPILKISSLIQKGLCLSFSQKKTNLCIIQPYYAPTVLNLKSLKLPPKKTTNSLPTHSFSKKSSLQLAYQSMASLYCHPNIKKKNCQHCEILF